MTAIPDTVEGKRLVENRGRTNYWRKWGSYVSERQWGTVREDYSPDARTGRGDAWNYFPHDHARSRAYRWGEDGIAGISDIHQNLCFALALWNGADPILKERLFGLTNNEGNHGEDVKEYYFFLDNTPTHSYMKCLYKYPQRAFPYQDLVQENGRRKATGSPPYEYELIDTGIFAEDRYFDVFIEYAKNTPEDILIRITAVNRGPESKELHLLPTLWLRNTWSWDPSASRPALRGSPAGAGRPDFALIDAEHPDLDRKYYLYCQAGENGPSLLFTENETNSARLFGGQNRSPYVKDSINDYVVSSGARGAVNPALTGTKAAAHYKINVAAGATETICLRLSDDPGLAAPFGAGFASLFDARKRDADEFYAAVMPAASPEEMHSVQRQAYAGMLWSKQYYYYVVEDWIKGDPAGPPPPPERGARDGRNTEWRHLYNEDILSMPDSWEYPWFAAWDLAFHTLALVHVDPEFAKHQLYLLASEWYMHPNGQIPAYEWAFGDVNPPVHAWAAMRVYKIEEAIYGSADREFLARIFDKLLLNFTWWVNQKDLDGNNVFEGGFLGMDNIGIFDRSQPLPTGGHIDQADGTSWMAMFTLNLLGIALELAKTDPSYVDMASKLFQHFLYIADSMNKVGEDVANLWDRTDQFYYDIIHLPPDGRIDGKEYVTMCVRSMVGLVPLFAVEFLSKDATDGVAELAVFRKRFDWFFKSRPDLISHENISLEPANDGYLLSLVSKEKLRAILRRMLDESEFLGAHGIRAVSRYHLDHPFEMSVAYWQNNERLQRRYVLGYQPAESIDGMFGGNSNWRGPIWFPMNYLLIDSLQKFHRYLGDEFQVEYPTGSGKMMNLREIAMRLSKRLIDIFLPGSDGKRPLYGGTALFQEDPHWKDLLLFYEYFHGDNGAGLGASHQTGWTGTVTNLIRQWSEYESESTPG